MSKKFIFIPLIFVVLIIMSISCAQIGAPVGGRKDTIPPKLVRSYPASRAVNFRGKRLLIEFDEYFTIKEQSKSLLVSPPLADKPEILIKGKSIQLNLAKPLDPDKTYSFNFGNSIQDLNEGNPLKNFQFVVSTGSSVDSLCISGQVVEASDLKPMKDVYVMLYDKIVDSIPRKTLPEFIGKTDEKGFFSIQNITKKKYRIFALKDMNANYRYDMPTEEIAFNDSTYNPTAYRGSFKDTIKIPVPNDTIFRDSVVTKMKTFFNPNNVKLYLFQEDNLKQYVKAYDRKNQGKISLFFNKGQIGEVGIKPLNFSPKGDWYVRDRSLLSDSLAYWITDPDLLKKDTLKISVSYLRLDSLKQPFTKIDTLKLSYQAPKVEVKAKKEEKSKNKSEKEKIKIISVVENVMISGGSILDLYHDPIILLKEPIKTIDLQKIHLYELEDKTKKDVKFELEKDSLKNTMYTIKAKWTPQSRYSFYIERDAIAGILGLKSDSTNTTFQIQKEDVYGVVNFKMLNFPSNTIVECVTKDDKLVVGVYTKKDGIAEFKTLKPGKYKFRVVVDLNGNKRWDTGDFSKNKKPEEVIPFGKVLEVKANWTNDLDWDYKTK